MSMIPQFPDEPPEPKAPEPLIAADLKRYSAEDIAKINKALEATDGSRKPAAEILGMELSRLNAMIGRYPALAARWVTNESTLSGEVQTSEVTSVNRTLPKPLALSTNEKMAVALSVQEKSVKRSLAKLGFKTSEIEAISSVEEFAGQFFDQTLSIMHGGLLKSAMRLMLLAEKIEQTYLQDEGLEERERKWWWDQYFRILEKLRDMNEQTNKAALTKALIEMKKKEAAGGGQAGKIGFQPLSAVQVNVTGAKEVSVNDTRRS